jgi:hypothetical protein
MRSQVHAADHILRSGNKQLPRLVAHNVDVVAASLEDLDEPPEKPPFLSDHIQSDELMPEVFSLGKGLGLRFRHHQPGTTERLGLISMFNAGESDVYRRADTLRRPDEVLYRRITEIEAFRPLEPVREVRDDVADQLTLDAARSDHARHG